MSLVAFTAENHPQQTRYRGSRRNVDDRALHQDFFNISLQKEFRFTVDAAAAAHNAKLPRYWTEQDDGLTQSWAGERVYCNPPYSNIEPWVLKAWSETGADIIVMLLPANRTEQAFWQNHIEPRRDQPGSPLTVRFLPGRIRFLKPRQQFFNSNDRPPFGCCLCIWNHKP